MSQAEKWQRSWMNSSHQVSIRWNSTRLTFRAVSISTRSSRVITVLWKRCHWSSNRYLLCYWKKPRNRWCFGVFLLRDVLWRGEIYWLFSSKYRILQQFEPLRESLKVRTVQFAHGNFIQASLEDRYTNRRLERHCYFLKIPDFRYCAFAKLVIYCARPPVYIIWVI